MAEQLPIAPLPPLLSVKELASVLHRSVRELGRMREAGLIPPPLRLRGVRSRPLWKASDVVSMIDALDGAKDA